MPIIIIVLIIGFYLFLVFPSTRRHPDRHALNGLYIAHRGLHNLEKNIPENSIPAFMAAIKHGFCVENDIHLTLDGEVVVFHDDDLIRACGDKRKICELTLSQIKELRLFGTNEQIPTLKECLEAVNGQVPLMIEFKVDKGNWKQLSEKANELLLQYKGKYFIQSFYPQVLFWYRKNRKDIIRGQLSSGYIGKEIYKKMLSLLLFNFLSRPDFISYEHKYSNKPSLKIQKLLGAFPICWTLQNEIELKECKGSFKGYIFENFIPK